MLHIKVSIENEASEHTGTLVVSQEGGPVKGWVFDIAELRKLVRFMDEFKDDLLKSES